jgi:hypothetical protein
MHSLLKSIGVKVCSDDSFTHCLTFLLRGMTGMQRCNGGWLQSDFFGGFAAEVPASSPKLYIRTSSIWHDPSYLLAQETSQEGRGYNEAVFHLAISCGYLQLWGWEVLQQVDMIAIVASARFIMRCYESECTARQLLTQKDVRNVRTLCIVRHDIVKSG